MVSVVIPAYGHAPYLPEAVHSALRAREVREILLVDDGSSDGTAEVVERLARAHPGRVRDLGNREGTNRGAHARLNELVEAASEEWVAVLNSDDVFLPGRFGVIERFLGESVSFLCGDLLILDEEGAVIGRKRGALDPEYPFPSEEAVVRKVREGELLELLASQNFVATTSNMVFRKALHERVGGFRAFRYVHDWDFALRASALGGGRYVPHFLTAYRLHGGNTIRDAGAGTAGEVRAMLRSFFEDFPELRERAAVERALRSNRYLDPGAR